MAVEQRPVIFADNRESKSLTCQCLQTFDADIQHRQLEVGDYILSDRVACERKTVDDFLQSIVNQRIFSQMESLAKSYENPLLVIEGSQSSLFNGRGIHPNTIRGVLSAIAVDYKIPIIWTKDASETAAQMFWIARREQVMDKREVQIRAKKKNYTLSDEQEFLVSGLPTISTTMSRRLLAHFKTPRKLFNAKVEDLMKVEKIGKIKAERIKKIIESRYEKPD